MVFGKEQVFVKNHTPVFLNAKPVYLKNSKVCRRRKTITLDAAGRRILFFFPEVSQNEDPLCPPSLNNVLKAIFM